MTDISLLDKYLPKAYVKNSNSSNILLCFTCLYYTVTYRFNVVKFGTGSFDVSVNTGIKTGNLETHLRQLNI